MSKLAYVLCLTLAICSLCCVPAVAQSGRCAGYQLPTQVGMITHSLLDQVSGIVSSRYNENVWWVINNSGHDTQVHAITTAGRLLATYDVVGTSNWDWEDLSIGPNADGSGPALYIGDIGDDDLIRNGQVTVYRIDEPNFNPLQALIFPVRGRVTNVETFHARYPDGRMRNAESLFVDQDTGQIYIVTNEEPSVVYRYPMPLTTEAVVTLERVAVLYPTDDESESAPVVGEGPSMANGAGVTSDGLRVVVRNDHQAYEYHRYPGEAMDALFYRAPIRFRLAVEAQGEAIGYTSDDMSVVTTSKILPSPLSMVSCGTWE